MPIEISKFRKPFWNTVRLINQDKNYNIPTRSKKIAHTPTSTLYLHSPTATPPSLPPHLLLNPPTPLHPPHRIHPQPALPWRRPCPCTRSAPQRLFTTSLVRRQPRKRPRRRRRDVQVRRRGRHGGFAGRCVCVRQRAHGGFGVEEAEAGVGGRVSGGCRGVGGWRGVRGRGGD